MSKSKSETDQLREGTRVFVHGEAAYLWIQDYNGLVFTMGTVMRTPKPTDKKVLVILDMLGDKWDVVTTVRRTALKIARQPSAKEGDAHVHA